MPKGEKKSMKYVTTKMLEYYSVTEELTIANKTYLCRVIVCGSYGKFSIYYWALQYDGNGKWDTAHGIVTHWAEIPEVYDIDDDKIL